MMQFLGEKYDKKIAMYNARSEGTEVVWEEVPDLLIHYAVK